MGSICAQSLTSTNGKSQGSARLNGPDTSHAHKHKRRMFWLFADSRYFRHLRLSRQLTPKVLGQRMLLAPWLRRKAARERPRFGVAVPGQGRRNAPLWGYLQHCGPAFFYLYFPICLRTYFSRTRESVRHSGPDRCGAIHYATVRFELCNE
jgi:hypothetical protein